MPKISSKPLSVELDGLKSNYQLEVMYTSELLFYIVLPTEFDVQYDHLTDKEIKQLSAKKVYRNKYNTNSNYKRAIVSEKEATVLEKVKDAILYLMKLNVQKRKVIMIRPNLNTETWKQLTQNEHYKDEYQEFRLGLGFVYCEETKAGSNVIYKRYYEYEDFQGNKELFYSKVDLDKRSDIVIDDTPENRLFLETLYKKLFNLNSKLREFTATPDKFLSLIASNQKLLS